MALPRDQNADAKQKTFKRKIAKQNRLHDLYSQNLLKDHLVLARLQEVASILCVDRHCSAATDRVEESILYTCS